MVDRRGTPICIGSRVAYNLSGQTALGVVVGLPLKGPGVTRISPDLPWSRIVKFSSVKHPETLVVLKPEDTP